MVRPTVVNSSFRPAAAVAAPSARHLATRIVPVLAPGDLCATVLARPSPRTHLLTASALLQARPRLAALLAVADCETRTVGRWGDLLDAIEGEHVEAGGAGSGGVALVDLDDANRAAGGGVALSGHRLVALLARRARARGYALVVQTALDYAEVEAVVRLGGVCALPHPDLTDEQIAAQIHGVLRRLGVPTMPRTDTVEVLPVDAPLPLAAECMPTEAAPWAVAGWPGADAANTLPTFG